MHLQTRIAITALAAPVFLATCSLEAYAQDAYSAASPETETSAAQDCPEHDPDASTLPPQEELARDIRTIVTGVKSPVQQEALAQAARIAPGQMSDALREVLVDATAFVNSLLPVRRETDDARPDSLSRLLACALQPHFSQDELTADILSITRSHEENDRLEPVRWARQETAAWLAMHIPPGEIEEKLRHAVVEGVAGISGENYSMYTTRQLLFETLINQTPGGMEALAANPEEAVGPGILDCTSHVLPEMEYPARIKDTGTSAVYPLADADADAKDGDHALRRACLGHTSHHGRRNGRQTTRSRTACGKNGNNGSYANRRYTLCGSSGGLPLYVRKIAKKTRIRRSGFRSLESFTVCPHGGYGIARKS